MNKSVKSFISVSLILLIIFFLGSCRNDFDTIPNRGNLEFSQDTVFLDTVFSDISSSTYQFKVYNRSNQDINIPEIALDQGESSNYRLNVDGIPGKTFKDIPVLANDSLFIFVEVTADIETLSDAGTQFIYEDQINFDSGDRLQKVNLVSLIQDAVFLFPDRFADGTTESLLLGTNEDGEEIRIEGFFLDDANLTFTNEKPYVVYGFAGVPSGKTLNIEPGARIHFHENSGIIAANQSSVQANGLPSEDEELMENEIIFESDRLEPEFSDVPGQWTTIWLTAGSTNHKFSHTTIKNATVGILMESNDGFQEPTLSIDNTQVYNCSTVGILGRTAHIAAENLVVNNCGQASLFLSYGGKYEFKHSTIANYWQQSFRQFPSVLINNYFVSQEDTLTSDLIEANFENSIIYGNERRELIMNRSDEATFNVSFKNSLIKFQDFDDQFEGLPLYNFDNETIYNAVIINQNPDFRSPEDNDLIIGEGSGANAVGNQPAANDVPTDILGKDRTNNPDAGAYQSIIFEDE
ncbi:MAG: hypothetical protein RI535_03105 [Psychroflexus sp.]|nr:hypothetical protein [Psychroflexus sp.]